MTPKIPRDKEIFEGEIATYWIEDGILVSLSKDIQRTVENISNNVAFVKKITKGKKMPLLIYLVKSPIPDKATRKLSAEQVSNIYKAMAMVSEPGLSVLIMKLVFKLKTPPIPMKNFSNEKDARNWLKQF